MSFHVRRTDKEITDPVIMKKILKSAQYVTLALSMDNQPYLVSLNYGYDENHNCIYYHCAKEGKKLVYIKSNNTVWGQVVLDHGYAEGKCTHLYASVHFSGKVIFLDSFEEKRVAMECMMQQLDKNPEPLKARLSPNRLNSIVTCRIDIDRMSGKKSPEITI
jgi:hypothetical protein